MSQKQLSQWRTVVVVLVVAAMLVTAFRWIATGAVPPGEFIARIFDTLAWTLLFLAVTAAGKSSIEHLAGGGGVKGALRALLADSKPAEPKPPAKEGTP
jgi:hypothetical protein